MGTRRDERPMRRMRRRGGNWRTMSGAASAALFASAITLLPAAAEADGWLFSGAEVPQGYFGTAYYEVGQTAPISLTCAWRRDGESSPLFLDDSDFEGVAPTTPGSIRFEISTEIAGGYGEEAPELTIKLGDKTYDELSFTGDVIGYLYYSELPQDGPLIQAMKAGGELAVESSLAAPWSAKVDQEGEEAVKMLQEFCARRQQQG